MTLPMPAWATMKSRRLHLLGEAGRRQHALILHVRGRILSAADLREDLLVGPVLRPFIHRLHETVERQHGADSGENHRTAPQYCNLSRPARCGHIGRASAGPASMLALRLGKTLLGCRTLWLDCVAPGGIRIQLMKLFAANLLPKNFNVLIKVSSRLDGVVSSREH